MQGNAYLNNKEWKSLINKKSADEFQEICYQILDGLGFFNVRERGSGSDGGRDLEGEFEYVYGRKDRIREMCWFECKNWKKGISYREIQHNIQKSEDSHVDRYILLSVSSTTPQCKDDIRKWNQNHRCKVMDWSGMVFLDCLFLDSETCGRYFSEQKIPKICITSKQMNEKIINPLSEFDIISKEDFEPKKFEIKKVEREKYFLACPICKLEREGWMVQHLHSMIKNYYFYGDEKTFLAKYFKKLKIDISNELKTQAEQRIDTESLMKSIFNQRKNGINSHVKAFIDKFSIKDIEVTKCYKCKNIVFMKDLLEIKKKTKFLICPYCQSEMPDIEEYKASFEHFFGNKYSGIVCCIKCGSILDKRFVVYNEIEKSLRHSIFDHLRVTDSGIVGQPYDLNGVHVKNIQSIAEKLNCNIRISGYSTHYERCFSIHVSKPKD